MLLARRVWLWVKDHGWLIGMAIGGLVVVVATIAFRLKTGASLAYLGEKLVLEKKVIDAKAETRKALAKKKHAEVAAEIKREHAETIAKLKEDEKKKIEELSNDPEALVDHLMRVSS